MGTGRTGPWPLASPFWNNARPLHSGALGSLARLPAGQPANLTTEAQAPAFSDRNGLETGDRRPGDRLPADGDKGN